MPLYLNTRAPDVLGVKDLGDANKIALPAVKISTMALVLQMAAEKEFGEGKFDALDHLTISPVSIPTPWPRCSPARARSTRIHLAAVAGVARELEHPGVRTILIPTT